MYPGLPPGLERERLGLPGPPHPGLEQMANEQMVSTKAFSLPPFFAIITLSIAL